jgi:hypothetical protein
MLGGWKAHTWHCVYIRAGTPLLDLHLVTAKSYLYILEDLIHKQAILLSAYLYSFDQDFDQDQHQSKKRYSLQNPQSAFTNLLLSTITVPFRSSLHRPPP